MRGCESFDRGSPKRAYTKVQMDFSLKVVARMQFGKHGVNRAQNSHNVLKKKMSAIIPLLESLEIFKKVSKLPKKTIFIYLRPDIYFDVFVLY